MSEEQYLSPVVRKGKLYRAYVSPVRYVHSAVRFSYRGLWRQARQQYFAAMDEIASLPKESQAVYPTPGDKCTANMLSKVITKWNVKDDDGVLLEVTPENLLDLDEVLFNRMSRIVVRMSESDLDPEDTADGQQKTLENGKKSAAELQTTFDLSELDDVGNSLAV